MKHLQLFAAMFFLAIGSMAGDKPASDSSIEHSKQVVAKIQRADYQGDRAALKKLHDELAPQPANAELGSRISYWRGFALWRSAINGFNDSAKPEGLQADLNGAIADFEEAIKQDPASADAKSAEAACLMTLLFMNQKDAQYVQERIPRLRTLLNEAQTTAPDNPRVLWVVGGGLWYRPVDKGGGQQKAMEIYERGLKIMREKPAAKSSNPLEPSWGEPELLMNLAWSNLNRTEPDLDAAEKYANEALHLVPDWHYVRDILIPQIHAAKSKKQ